MTKKRLALMVASGGGSSLALLAGASPLMQFHEWLCRSILTAARVPIDSASGIVLLPGLGSVEAPVVSVPPTAAVWRLALTVVGLILLILALFHRRYPLGRSLVAFVFVLVLVACGVALLRPDFTIGSDAFTALWLRTQVVLWILLPWVASLLVLPVEPSAVRGVGWIFLVEAYALVWSPLRLAFCLGVLHHTGIVLLTALWFGVGPLCDLLYILVFYSLAVRSASRRIWGVRQ